MKQYKKFKDMGPEEINWVLEYIKTNDKDWASTIKLIEFSLASKSEVEFKIGDGVETIYSLRMPLPDSNIEVVE